MFNTNSIQGNYIGNAGALAPNPLSAGGIPLPPGSLAGNPFGPAFQIPGRKPGGQPVLPGENKKMIEDVYGRPGPQPMPGSSPLALPMAMGTPVIGNMAGFLGQGIPPGYVNKYLS